MLRRIPLRPNASSFVLPLLLALVALHTCSVLAYDFTNLGATDTPMTNSLSPQDQAVADAERIAEELNDATQQQYENERHVLPTQTPIHWFMSKLYGDRQREGATNGSLAGIPTALSSADAAERPRDYTFVRLPDNYNGSMVSSEDDTDDDGGDSKSWKPLPDEKVEEEAVQYNVSFLGRKDPFARHATKLSYDYRIDVGEARNNGRGSIVSLLNGTIYPLGSVGAMSAVGWSGGSNESHHHPPLTPTSGNSTSNTTSPSGGKSDAPGGKSKDDARSSNASASASGSLPSASAHNDGMTGIWLAFTSQHALTGGYTMHAKHLSVTNNVLFHNVTFRSNYTIDAQGRFAFVFTLGTVDETDQTDGDGTSTRAAKNTTDARHSLGSMMEHVPPERPRTNTARDSSRSPIRLEGPRCTPMEGTSNTEAAFRMRCEGIKVDLSKP